MNSNCRSQISVIILLAVFLLPLTTTARWTSVDPLASKYPSVSPYVYTLNNPLKYIDPDGRDVAFHVYQSPNTKGFGHLDMHFQDSKGTWFKYDQGNYGVNISPSEGPPTGSLLLNTTSEQDGLIASSAVKSKEGHDSGDLKYNEYTNNCKDAAVAVVNNSGAGITVDNGSLTPTGWANDQKKAVVQLKSPQGKIPSKIPSDKTTTVVEILKFEIVPPPPDAN